MKIKTIRFRSDRSSGYRMIVDRHVFLCDTILRDLFDVPISIKYLDVILYNRPAKDRAKICVDYDGSYLVDGTKVVFGQCMGDIIDDLVEKYVTFWAEIWYE